LIAAFNAINARMAARARRIPPAPATTAKPDAAPAAG
ncbi:MAG: electron transport complex subunit RsxE, partial [Betaproteobacteria bacterium HGW-Betaproteobacteria-21]